MGRLTGCWALWLWTNGALWGTGRSQRPGWYYGELGPHYGAPDPPEKPTEPSFPGRTVLLYSYWIGVGFAVALAVLWAALRIKQVLLAPKPRDEVGPPCREDPEDVTFLETLHLLDAVVAKTWRHLDQLERAKRRWKRRTGCCSCGRKRPE